MRCCFIVTELCHEINMDFSGASGPNKSSFYTFVHGRFSRAMV